MIRRLVLAAAVLATMTWASCPADAYQLQLQGLGDAAIGFQPDGKIIFNNNQSDFPVPIPAGFTTSKADNTVLNKRYGEITGDFRAINIVGNSADIDPLHNSGTFYLYDDSGLSKGIQGTLTLTGISLVNGVGGLTGTVTDWTSCNSSTTFSSVLTGSGHAVFSFQVLPSSVSLPTVFAGSQSTTYSGTLSQLPEPSCLSAIAGMGLVVLLWARRRKRT
jgi:hypothetical protein